LIHSSATNFAVGNLKQFCGKIAISFSPTFFKFTTPLMHFVDVLLSPAVAVCVCCTCTNCRLLAFIVSMNCGLWFYF